VGGNGGTLYILLFFLQPSIKRDIFATLSSRLHLRVSWVTYKTCHNTWYFDFLLLICLQKSNYFFDDCIKKCVCTKYIKTCLTVNVIITIVVTPKRHKVIITWMRNRHTFEYATVPRRYGPITPSFTNSQLCYVKFSLWL
jgi:hypothetical protein